MVQDEKPDFKTQIPCNQPFRLRRALNNSRENFVCGLRDQSDIDLHVQIKLFFFVPIHYIRSLFRNCTKFANLNPDDTV